MVVKRVTSITYCLMSVTSSKLRFRSIPHYERRGHFLGKREIAAYHVLRQVFDEDISVCPKVRLAELVTKFKPKENEVQHWSKVQLEKIDFLVCAGPTIEPLLAIKLVTNSNIEKRRTRGRDAFEDVLQDIGLPLLRMKARNRYKKDEVARMINIIIQENQEARPVFQCGSSDLETDKGSQSTLDRSLSSTLRFLKGIKDVYRLRTWRAPADTPN